MIDPDLSHLYADALAEDDDELEELVALKAAAARPTSLEALTLEQNLDEDPVDEHDAEELALLVRARITDGTLTDELSAELGLGELVLLEGPGTDGTETELVLNATGRAVIGILARDAIERGDREA